MGNYTTLDMTVRVNERFSEVEHLFTPKALDIGSETRRVFRAALWKKESHPFFKLDYADNILSSYKCNGRKEPALTLVNGLITIRTTIKNYNEEIQAFFDWIAPYVDLSTLEGECKYEEWHYAASVKVKDGKIELDKSNIWGHRDNGFFGCVDD